MFFENTIYSIPAFTQRDIPYIITIRIITISDLNSYTHYTKPPRLPPPLLPNRPLAPLYSLLLLLLQFFQPQVFRVLLPLERISANIQTCNVQLCAKHTKSIAINPSSSLPISSPSISLSLSLSILSPPFLSTLSLQPFSPSFLSSLSFLLSVHDEVYSSSRMRSFLGDYSGVRSVVVFIKG